MLAVSTLMNLPDWVVAVVRRAAVPGHLEWFACPVEGEGAAQPSYQAGLGRWVLLSARALRAPASGLLYLR